MMKKLLLLIFLVLTCTITKAQDSRDSIVRSLDNLEREAFLKGDSLALFNKLWSPNMVVHNPQNKVGTVEEQKC